MESEIRALIVPLSERLIKQLVEAKEQAAHQSFDLFALEMLVSKALGQFALSLLAGLIGVWYGRGKTVQAVSCPSCAAPMKFQCYTRRPLLRCAGRFSYGRALYYCRACHESRVPLDEQLGVSARRVTPRLQRVVAYLAGHLSFGIESLRGARVL